MGTKGRRVREVWHWCGPLVSALVALAGNARADEAANTATARALGSEGVTLADSGKCAEAVERLERAERLHHAPTTATRLGECEIELGKLVAGTERLQRVVREPMPANVHPAFAAAVVRAQKALEKALPRIATLRVSIKAPAGAKFTVSIDDEALPDAMLDISRRIDPGTHKIQVTGPGLLPASTSLALEDGETKSASLDVEADPNAAPDARPSEARAVASANLAQVRRGSKLPAILAFSAGALGVGMGIVGGVQVAQKASSLSGACDGDKVCPEGSRTDIRDAKTWATVSTTGFIVGGVGIVAGVVLLLTSSSSAEKVPQSGLRVTPMVGPGSAALRGEF
jgi:hypothetical protein